MRLLGALLAFALSVGLQAACIDPPPGEFCMTDAECDDGGNPCTTITCVHGHCSAADEQDASPCPGSNTCTDTFICRRGQCVPGPASLDADGDGFVAAECPFGSDCADTDPAVHPGAEGPRGAASCTDGLDNDCDGAVDYHDPDCWEPICSPDGWCLNNPRPTTNSLNGLWAPAPDDVWAVGDLGEILHWDGTGWRRVDSPAENDLPAICGCGLDAAWAAWKRTGLIYYHSSTWIPHLRWTGQAWKGMSCRCEQGTVQEVWIVGSSDHWSRYEADTWTHGELDGARLSGVWAPGPGEAWLIAANWGLVHHQDGVWEPVPFEGIRIMNSIWGAAPDRAWVVGEDGEVATWDGLAWNLTDDLGEPLNDVWALGEHLWVAGQGSIHDRIADGWNRVDLGDHTIDLNAIRGFSDQDMWAVGDNGAILHGRDGAWTLNHVTLRDLTGLCATAGPGGRPRLWAVGAWEGGCLQSDGGAWRPVSIETAGAMSDVFCAGKHGVYAVGGRRWAYWGDGVREGGIVPGIEGSDNLKHLAGRVLEDGRVELLAVGNGGKIAWYDGEAWTSELMHPGSRDMYDVWLSPDLQAPLQAVAVGQDGGLYTFDGATWTRLLIGDNDYNGVWGDGQGGVWVVGYNQLLRWNETSFEQIYVPGGVGHSSVITGTGPEDIWILKNGGVVTFDGTQWAEETFLPASTRYWGLDAMHVTPTDVWAMGRGGIILHRKR